MTKLFFDCETTSLIPKGAKYDKDYDKFPHIVQLAWKKVTPEAVTVMNLIIKPHGYIIPDDSIKIHGITNEIANEKGMFISDALDWFLKEADSSDKIIAHNIYFDTSVIKALSLRNCYDPNFLSRALHKSKRICTMMKTVKFCGCRKPNGSGKFPSLQDLHKKLFGCEFENAHNAKYDVLALEKCYNELVRIGHLTE